jgi:membrane dipeptidase
MAFGFEYPIMGRGMKLPNLHDDLVVVDGLNVSNWSRAVFENMRKGGITAANCTCSVWENFRRTMDNIAQWQRWFTQHDDILLQVHSVADISRAKAEGKTGIILGFQNVSAFEDRLDYIPLFKALGVGIVQIAYNTQNLVGTGCYESRDGGLSDFGREVIAEMNRTGMMCDLSHVGPKTSEDVIKASSKPVCYSHCLPAGLKEHPRNKTDHDLKFIADRGGFIGVTMFSPFLKRGIDATVDDYVTAIDYMINLLGEQSVGIGTDFTQDQDPAFFRWITRDKGRYRKLTEFGVVRNPEGIRTIGDLPNLTAAMQRAGWPEGKIRKIMGENWMRILKDVWDV